jgi:hypothetical protein
MTETTTEHEHWGVLSDDGETYRVGVWRQGVWIPGDKNDAEREQAVLIAQGEAGATVVQMDPPSDSGVSFPLGVHAVTDLPNWHTHPECLGLTHGHGEPLRKPEPHTHERKVGWGDAVPCEPGVAQAAMTWHAYQMEHLSRLTDAKTVLLDHNATGHSGTHDTAVLINALNDAANLLNALIRVVGNDNATGETYRRVTMALDLLRTRMNDSHYVGTDE